MKPVIPRHLLTLEPYKPGRPIEEVEREMGIRAIKVASNENPLGPSPKALAALTDACAHLHRYPEGAAVLLAERLARALGTTTDRLTFGNGSYELIELLVRVFAGEGDEIVMSSDAFLVYRLVTTAVGAKAVRVPARGFHHDTAAMAAAIGPATKVVFVASPNNPTGTIVSRAEWGALLDRVPEHVVVVVDQAYREFVDDPDYADALADVHARPNVVVLRTFSKIYGLAGLRLGYAVSPPEIADVLARIRQPFNVNSLAQAAAIAALDDTEHFERSRAHVIEARRRWARALDALGLEWVPTQANFVLVRVGKGAHVTQAMLERGVIVRPMDAYGLPDMIRITFGTHAEDEKCLDALGAVVKTPSGAVVKGRA
jgi:histidinol-phosphate aminotransferase